MLQFLFLPETIAFTVALLLMLLLGAVEALALGGVIDLDLEPDTALGGALDWLNVGRMPLLMLLVLFLTAFGLTGLVLQQVALSLLGGPLPGLAAVPAAALLALPATRVLSGALAKILPRDETTAVDLDSLLGRRARIVVGRAQRGNPARARVEDRFGQAHYVLVEPEDADDLGDAAILLLTRRDGNIFRVIELEPDVFSQIGSQP
jgi:hypothetical protein